jgi:hypothetical protein
MTDMYAKAVGQPTDGDIAAAEQYLRWHTRRQRWDDDYLSAVAIEFMSRLGKLRASPNVVLSFPKLVDRCADAVRHRIVREAQRKTKMVQAHDPQQIKSGPDYAAVLALIRELPAAEQVVLSGLMNREPVAELAERLGVGPRTIYRRLRVIARRLFGHDR